MQAMVEQEIRIASIILTIFNIRLEEPQTLFRGNSMASKALDLYMKFVGKGITIFND